ncbi:MAG: acyl-CoA dehydratase activase-related protein, partial [Candidatus Adiutrix sp.]|nr:acyl-CoA dehydratase activase-related protein [Candidatus Adiutrix sp.]
PVWSKPTDKDIIRQGCEKTGGEFCFPIKAAHGHLADLLERRLDYIFLPSAVNLPPGDEGGEKSPDTASCPYVQALPYFAGAALNLAPPRLVGGPVFFGEGDATLFRSLVGLAKPLGLGQAEIKTAMFQALLAQDLFSRRLLEKGREVLDSLGPEELALVVVARPYNGFDPGLNLRLNRKLAELGLLGLPMDFLPLKAGAEAAAHYWRYGQKITAAADFIARDPRLAAVYISNFGCGPDSFILHFFKHRLGGRPFLEIEIDEHSSDVGAVTRLEAFLDSLAARRGRPPAPASPPAPLAVTRAPRLGQAIYIPHMCDHVLAVAAAFRHAGHMAEVLPPSDRETVELGRSQTSGKECYPLILTVGDFLKAARRPDFSPGRSAFFMPATYGPCRFGQYGRYLRLVLERLGLGRVDVVSIDQTGGMYRDLDAGGGQGEGLSRRLWRALAATDLLQKAWRRTRPRENQMGAADAAYHAALADLVKTLEDGRELEPVMARARERFESAWDRDLPAGAKPRVGLVGEIYVRHNPFANENLIRRLEDLGAEVEAPPFTEWVFYLNFVRAMRARRAGDWKKRLAAWAVGWTQKRDLKKLAAPWQGFFPRGALEPPVDELIVQAEKFVHRSFQGEAVLSLGKGVEFFNHGAAGLVNIMPFTCMPGQVTGGLTMSFRAACQGLPCLNLSFDGQSQTNTQTRLEAFMSQVRAFRARAEG